MRNLFGPDTQRPWLIAAGVAFVFFIFMLFNGGLLVNFGQIVLDGAFCAGGFLFWMVFFAQFVLPVKNLQERNLAFSRLWNYFFGSHGPAVMVRNGEVIKRKGEMQRRGPGVIVLDSSSAAVLRSPTRVTRTVGPGVVFTYGSETILDSVDLHVQKRKLGPWMEDGDPFEPIKDGEIPAAYEARQKRARETRAMTRDGIEVIPDLLITFRLKADPGEGGTEFGYRQKSVEMAILGRGIDLSMPTDAPDRQTRWTWLPPYLAADVWRELLAKFTMDELFQTVPDQPGALETIQRMIRERLMKRKASQLDDFGHPILQEVDSKEFSLLERRGIEIISVSVTNLRFPAEIEQQLVNRWKAGWLKRAQDERDMIDRERSRAAEAGRGQALLEYAELTTSEFAKISSPGLLTGQEILRHLLRGNIDLLTRDVRLQELAQDELKQLSELLEWVEQEAPET